MDAKALSAIQLCLSNEVLREIVKDYLQRDMGKVEVSLYGKERDQPATLKE